MVSGQTASIVTFWLTRPGSAPAAAGVTVGGTVNGRVGAAPGAGMLSLPVPGNGGRVEGGSAGIPVGGAAGEAGPGGGPGTSGRPSRARPGPPRAHPRRAEWVVYARLVSPTATGRTTPANPPAPHSPGRG